MVQTAKLLAVTGMATGLLFSTCARPAPWETLIMPGPVIQEHAKYEIECSKCHARFSKASQTELCLACHEEIAADIDKREGFHGKSNSVTGSECKTCHTEHEGRDADVVKLNRESFDHDTTDFTLEHAHLKTSCDSCHDRGKAYAEAPSACHSCHEDDDSHQDRLGEQCNDCHNTAVWGDAEYDHDKTDFPLQGKHEEVSCDICHPNERYEHTPSGCISCHRLNDVHKGRRGSKCESCHSPQAWDKSRFDHGKNTDFPLRGRHGKINCDDCHDESVEKKTPKSDCYACHQNDDDHHGRHGRQCDTCHDSEDWSHAKFDHGNETDFPLIGAHVEVACSLCHRGNTYDDKLEAVCTTCHQTDDVHKGQEGRTCERCHNERGWVVEVAFDHDLTRFPLLGMHSTMPCEECHMSGEFKHAAILCAGCHGRDDTHKGTLGPKCEQCHNPNAWGLWLFDHDKQTGFSLDGAHDELTCDACHTAPTINAVKQTKVCDSCHRGDDVHSGRFGRNCDRCHNTESFTEVSLGR